MAEYRAFTLSPGQQAPAGSTARCLKTGEIVWHGELPFPDEIANREMTEDEINWFENEPVENAALLAQLAALVDNMTFDQVETHIDTVFSGLSAAQRTSLKNLYRVVLYLAKNR